MRFSSDCKREYGCTIPRLAGSLSSSFQVTLAARRKIIRSSESFKGADRIPCRAAPPGSAAGP
jgi:hypothetical protein